MSKTTVSRWLNGEQEPKNLTELVNLADSLGITTDELLGHKTDISPFLDLIRKLPKDLREQELKRLQKLVEDYKRV